MTLLTLSVATYIHTYSLSTLESLNQLCSSTLPIVCTYSHGAIFRTLNNHEGRREVAVCVDVLFVSINPIRIANTFLHCMCTLPQYNRIPIVRSERRLVINHCLLPPMYRFTDTTVSVNHINYANQIFSIVYQSLAYSHGKIEPLITMKADGRRFATYMQTYAYNINYNPSNHDFDSACSRSTHMMFTQHNRIPNEQLFVTHTHTHTYIHTYI